ncbi:hypothetical protein AB0G67_45845 [Streptomyces sp. NPDC021056]
MKRFLSVLELSDQAIAQVVKELGSPADDAKVSAHSVVSLFK